MIEFSWDIHHTCNYSCPYCWFHDKWDEIKKNNTYPGLKYLLDIWKTIYDKYGCVQIEIAGGEPFTYPEFIEFVSEISKIHKLGITTNLSGDIELFVKKVNRDNVNIGASLHPLFIDIDTFFRKAALVKESGIMTQVLFLAWPPQIKYILDYKRMFEAVGINFSVLSFWGRYNGKEYPQGYSDDEREILSSVLGTRGESGEKYQLTPKITKGKLCRAGQTYALIHPNGDVYRCGGGNWKVQHAPFTNLFSKDFHLLSEPLPCDSEQCPCNEWSFLLVDNKEE